ncbi:MAG: ABC transporter ATP-binding protein [Acidobacteriota bacterium]|nr:ABC transporter ATP-binding protein [Acidobacteriota bacterium]
MSTAAPAEASAYPVRARALVKRYGEILAVDKIDLTVHAGEVYGFLGPNGAGKTTTLRMLLGLIMPTEGDIELFGRNPVRDGARALDGVAGFVEAPRFYPYLSARKNLQMMAALDGGDAASRIDGVLDLVDLAGAADQRVGGYSHGMGQRLGIAGALLRDPRLLVLDEPATGLDPAGIRDMRMLVSRLAGEGIAVLLSSHQLTEVQEVCDRVAIVRKGSVVYEGPIDELSAGADRAYRLHTSDDVRALQLAGTQRGIRDPAGGQHEIRFRAAEADLAAFSIALGQAGVAILTLTPALATLEDLFFQLTEGPAAGHADGRQREPAALESAA